MNDFLKKVEDFHNTSNSPVLNNPQIPTQDRCDLRVSLLQEELDELKDAINNFNIIEIADAITDIQYILIGTVLEFGLKDKFEDLFNEVHRSNMTKSCDTREEAEETVIFYHKKDGTIAHIVESEGKFIVFRTNDNKVLKSIKYSPASIGEVLYNDGESKLDISKLIADYKEEIKFDEETGTLDLTKYKGKIEENWQPPAQTPRAVIDMKPTENNGGPQSGTLGNVY